MLTTGCKCFASFYSFLLFIPLVRAPRSPHKPQPLFSAAGHIADHFIQRQWSVLAVRRLMTGIGLAGPGILMFLFSSYTTTYSAIW